MTKDEIGVISETIRNTVSCVDAGQALGIHTDYKGRCRCFFHGGDRNNLKLYGENRGYYCFVCHEHGDVIHLVMGYLKCSYMDAVRWLDEAFRLGLDAFLARERKPSIRSRFKAIERRKRHET